MSPSSSTASASSATARAAQPRSGAAPAPRRASERARPPLEVVGPAPRRRVRPGRIGTIAGVLLFSALFALAAFQTVLIKTQAHIDDVNKQVATQTQRQEDLGLALAELRSPERIITTAKEDLGMIEPGSVTYLQPAEDDDARAALPDGDGAPPGQGAGTR